MLIRFAILFLSISFLGSTVDAQSVAPENDFQVWNETVFSKPLQIGRDGKTERLSLTFGTNIRMLDDATRIGDWRLSAGLDRKVTSFLTLSGGYTFRRSSAIAGNSETEHRLRFDTNLDFKLNKLNIRSRNRFERLIRNDKADSTRFRPRILLSHPVSSNGAEIFSPFASAEVFYDMTASRVSRTEFIAGVSRMVSSNFTIEPFVGLRKNRSASFRNVGIVGMNLRIKLPR